MKGRAESTPLPGNSGNYSCAASASLAITFFKAPTATTVPIIIAATITRLGATEIKLYLSIELSSIFCSNSVLNIEGHYIEMNVAVYAPIAHKNPFKKVAIGALN